MLLIEIKIFLIVLVSSGSVKELASKRTQLTSIDHVSYRDGDRVTLSCRLEEAHSGVTQLFVELVCRVLLDGRRHAHILEVGESHD